MKRSMPIILSAVVLVVALLAGSDNALARPALQGGAPTVVSYQGQVRVGGRPYIGFVSANMGTLKCIGAYNETYDSISCPG